MYKKLPLTEDNKIKKAVPLPLVGPTNLVITSFPKSGKTLSFTNVPKMLIGNTEEGMFLVPPNNIVDLLQDMHTFKVAAKDCYIPKGLYEAVVELAKANDMNRYWELLNGFHIESDNDKKEDIGKRLLEHVQNMPFPIFVLDTITSLQELNNEASLAYYNSIVSIENRKKDIKKADNYGGVKYIRRNFRLLKTFIEKNASPYTIWAGHIGERKKILEKGEQEISVCDIALSGIQSIMFTADSDANAILYRDDKGVWLDFRKREETDLGSRVSHLAEKKILITDILSQEDLENKKSPVTHWNEVYPELF